MPEPLVDGFNTVFGSLIGHRASTADLYNVMFYFLALAMIIVIIFVTRRVDDSKIGRAWTAVREDETAAEAWASIPPR